MQSTGFWAALRATLGGFWFCRVSILGVLTGWLLFFAAPQAQAVFFDLHTWQVGWWHWAAFYGAVFLFWMLPTQLSLVVPDIDDPAESCCMSGRVACRRRTPPGMRFSWCTFPGCWRLHVW